MLGSRRGDAGKEEGVRKSGDMLVRRRGGMLVGLCEGTHGHILLPLAHCGIHLLFGHPQGLQTGMRGAGRSTPHALVPAAMPLRGARAGGQGRGVA